MTQPTVVQKLNKLETHDRLVAFKKFQNDIGAFIQSISDRPPFGNRPCYLFIVHKRSLGVDERIDLVRRGEYEKIEDTPIAFMDLQCRLGKPEMQPNTTLMKLFPGQDRVKMIWSLPEEETWSQFGEGKMFTEPFNMDSIHNYKKNKKTLEKREPDEPTAAEYNSLMMPYAKDRKRMLEALVRRLPVYAEREDYVKQES